MSICVVFHQMPTAERTKRWKNLVGKHISVTNVYKDRKKQLITVTESVQNALHCYGVLQKCRSRNQEEHIMVDRPHEQIFRDIHFFAMH